MVKHTYFSIKLSISKHSLVTVVNKRRKELNYGQKLAFQSTQIMTTETSRTGRQDRRIKIKIITFQGTQEHTRLRPRHLVVTIVSVPGFKELKPTTHISVLYNHY